MRVWTEDALQLQGLYCWKGGNSGLPAVLHIHGASSNFYRSQFLDGLADELNRRGFPFLTGNTRGHDIINNTYTHDPKASTQLGVAYERFEDCAVDITAWLEFLQDQGSAGVVLLGHSFGAHKVAFYQAETSDNRVKGLIFMSPADQGFWVRALGSQMEHTLAWAEEKVAGGEARTLLEGGMAPYPMSAGTIHSLFVVGKPDIFKFGAPSEPWEVVAKLSCPILAMMGTVAEFTEPGPRQAMDLLKAKATSSPRCETVVLEGAPHNYRGFEAQVTQVIAGWLSEVFGGAGA